MRVVPGTEHAVFAGDTHVGSGEATIVLADASGSLALLDELIEDLATEGPGTGGRRLERSR
jgi:acyl-CoA thioester hydrolase